MSARRYVDAATLEVLNTALETRTSIESAVARLDRRIETISNRQFRNIQNLETFGEKFSVETRTKRLKQRSGVGSKYRTEQAKVTEQYKRRAKRIRQTMDHIAPRDVKLIDKKFSKGWNALSDKEKKRFQKLFDAYPREQVLEALGSPVVR